MPIGDDAPWRFLTRLAVRGRPATFATAYEAAWKEAVRAAVAASGVQPPENARFRVAITFWAAAATRPDERWDIDNLVKPTLDAMEGVFGLRQWRGVPQPQDDRVDELVATKRTAASANESGAMIEVWFRQ